MKIETPNSKSQIPNKHQAPNTKGARVRWSAAFRPLHLANKLGVRILRALWDRITLKRAEARAPRTPPGFKNSAQGCDEGATLGSRRDNGSNRERVKDTDGQDTFLCNPFRVETPLVALPRVAPSSQPWAEFWNPFRILLARPNACERAARRGWGLGFGVGLVFGVWCLVSSSRAADSAAELKNLDDGTARLIFEAKLKGTEQDRTKLIFAAAIQHSIHASFDKLAHSILVNIDVLQGEPKEIALVLTGEGEVKQVTGEQLQDWSVRQQPGGERFLVLRPKKTERALTNLAVTLTAETELNELPKSITPLAISSSPAALSHGYVRIDADPALSVKVSNPTGVTELELKLLPEPMRAVKASDDNDPLAFRFHGSAYSLPLQITTADPETRRVVLSNFKLTSQITEDSAAFTLTATARVKNPKGGSIEVLAGNVALTEFDRNPKWRMTFDKGRFIAVFDEPGEYPIRLRFNAAVRHADGWNSIDLKVAPSALQPLLLAGLPADTQFRFASGARPERKGNEFVTFLPADGAVQLAWKTTKAESEGKLFYSAEVLAQISVAPGLMRQLALLEGKVMQGELTRVTLRLTGAGEVTRVAGEQVLAWNAEPIPNSPDRRLVIQFNQPQRDAFLVQVQMQTPLSAFPAAFDAMRIEPEGATRFAGYYRIVNDGAVRLEVVNATGLSQVSPEQFPETDTTRALFRADAKQRFVYRFSGASHALRISADNVLPEISLSYLLAYHLGENETAIDAELELDIREAPIRELLLTVPKGYALARLAAASMSDYFLTDQPNDAQLRIVFGQPVSGRHIVQLRLERNAALGAATWVLPRIDVPQAKSVRGHIAVSADAGFRLTPATTQGLSEIATAFFPRKVAGIQSALRVSEPAWQATMRVERLPQSIAVDAFHLFSIGERVAYGSSVMNYQISGAPVSALRVELTNEYFNIEFLGKDVRDWVQTNGVFEIHLHTPVSGAYTLLATYERTFKGQGDTLAFTGARPLDAQSEQGHTIVVSAYQLRVQPANVSPGLLALEPAEVPAEYRLFFDAPILAAYRYNARPFNLQLVLSPLTQGDTLSQVADRAALETHISKQGQVVTSAKYFVKNRGQPHFRLTLPAGTELWAATVNGVTAVPTLDRGVHLIPLPQRADPNAVMVVDLKLASRSKDADRVSVAAPIVGAPVLLSEWKLRPDAGQRLEYRKGSLAPAQGIADHSGFAQLFQLLRDEGAPLLLVIAIVLLLVGLAVWRWCSRAGVYKGSPQHVLGTLLGTVAIVVCVLALVKVASMAEAHRVAAAQISFVAPIQPAGNPLTVEVANLEDKPTVLRGALQAWPALFAVPLWLFALVSESKTRKSLAVVGAWALLFWAALRTTNGVPAFFILLIAFVLLHLVFPTAKRLWQLPARPKETTPPDTAAPAVVSLVLFGLLCFGSEVSATARNVAAQQSQRDCVVQPRVARNELPWVKDQEIFNPNGVVSRRNERAATPLGLSSFGRNSQGASFLATLGYGMASLWDSTLESVHPAGAPIFLAAAETPVLNIGKKRTRLEVLPIAESVQQQIRVEDKFAFATVKLRWNATKGQRLPFLSEPAVLTRISFPTNALKLIEAAAGTRQRRELLALQDGTVEVEFEYQVQPTKVGTETGFNLPTHSGLVNEVTLTLLGLDVDVTAPAAVSIERAPGILPGKGLGQTSGAGPGNDPTRQDAGGTFARLVLSPVPDAWIGWRPRSRDTKRERAVFYAELAQLYIPSAGVIEGHHLAQIRPAHGELNELTFIVPTNATITDVIDPSTTNRGMISLWRFDPDSRQLRVTLKPAQSRPFSVVIKSQTAVGTLPIQQRVGLISLTNAAGEIGSVGLATGSDVQLDNVTSEALTAINLEDFFSWLVQRVQAQSPGLTLRRAYRYADANAAVVIAASAVEPDVRVESQQTLSMGEDRTLLAANLSVEITRAGIFRLSFVLPTGLEVESISGAALSHWTQLNADNQRVITLHLQGKTVGQQQFSISLAGPGMKATNGWSVPRLALREASKQRGQLVIVPEQGMRLQVGARDGVTQLDPQRAGIRQKGVLAFRLLQDAWALALDVEQVDPWVQVQSLQHVAIGEAQIKVTANLQYQIENTGLKALRVFVPTNADSVQFRGEQVADFLPRAGSVTNGLQEWEVKLHRRIIGAYLLQVSYQAQSAPGVPPGPGALVPQPGGTPGALLLRGIEAAGVNLQRGFVTVEGIGRLRIDLGTLPSALQPSEWQSVPKQLRQDLEAAAANATFRLVEPSFQLAVKVQRHEAAKLLPAHVNHVVLKSVVSDDGMMLTHARLDMVPGDKRLLHLTLPAKAQFWFAFVNQNGVVPWLEQDKILIPLEQQVKPDDAIAVEFFYTSDLGAKPSRKLDVQLLGPKFDLPLEDITWQVFLNEKWKVTDWDGTLQLSEERYGGGFADLNSYLQQESARRSEKTKVAEQQLQLANNLLAQGVPQRARQAFQNAFELSQHDMAFNEDARVQLHNVKMQQALIGLNVRQAGGVASGAVAAKVRELRSRRDVTYTQDEAKQIFDNASADDNNALARLASRMIQQQEAAVAAPAAIRAVVPEQGRVLTFKRAVQVDTWADLRIDLEAKVTRAASLGGRFVVLLFVGAIVIAGLWLGRRNAAGSGTAGQRTALDS